jgi:hypothetical protein
MGPVSIDWATARVADARLRVQLEGVRPRGWKRQFERTVTLLPDGDWGEVRLKKREIRVSDIAPGSEAKLGHFLESVVEQANAVDPEASSAAAGPAGEHVDEDAEMTRTFRALAERGDRSV